MSKFDELSDKDIQIIEYALEDLRWNMRQNWDKLHDYALGWDINYIYEERGRQARELADLILQVTKEKNARDNAKRL